VDLKRGAAYWASSMAGLFLLLAFPALFDGIEGLRWPAFFELILKAVFYAVLGALLLASFHWQPAVTSGTVALVELIQLCDIFNGYLGFFSDPGVYPMHHVFYRKPDFCCDSLWQDPGIKRRSRRPFFIPGPMAPTV